MMILSLALLASVTNEYPTQKTIDSKIPIVDIRTPGEWRETGLAKGAIPIMFFNESGDYDIDEFLSELNEKVDTKKPFAIICRTGSRTKQIAGFLSEQLKYDVIDLQGGMMYFMKASHLPTVPYNE
jgi:rhodanese-related sulfurtransferase